MRALLLAVIPLLVVGGCATAPALYSPAALPDLDPPELPALPTPAADECAASVPVVPGVRPSCVDGEGAATCEALAIPTSRVWQLMRAEELRDYYRDRLTIERDERLLDRGHAVDNVREWEAAYKRERRAGSLLRVGVPVAAGVAFGTGVLIGLFAGSAAP